MLVALSDRACRTAGFEGIGRLSGHLGRDSPAGGFPDRLRENLRPHVADIGDGHGPDGVTTFCDERKPSESESMPAIHVVIGWAEQVSIRIVSVKSGALYLLSYRPRYHASLRDAA